MLAVKTTNLLTGAVHYSKADSHEDACDQMRLATLALDQSWERGKDYEIGIVEVEDGFDFENQPKWN